VYVELSGDAGDISVLNCPPHQCPKQKYALACAPSTGTEDVLRGLPDLAGERLRSGALSRESREEQRHAGLDRLDASEASRVVRLNAAYRARFGFPFVLCARENDKTSVVEQMRERLRNTRAQERARAVEEVKKIARLRLRGLVLPEREQEVRINKSEIKMSECKSQN